MIRLLVLQTINDRSIVFFLFFLHFNGTYSYVTQKATDVNIYVIVWHQIN